ncbi:hypothetical protein BU24DRAFT_488058 [Aaosphaeria arxii CBS 175.79]|uniref:Heterokaryon incompatibility domain-containing protein n=1 Tax=Aaosphaeria arxii CBS 175.79 TaxID=1450172 RepID=A0A6A5YAS0_9PLEO|nr:uncharacterized protein BU24DRAFT_488058 [Aaosphaeria arxii CBS 175.79]KAF2021684.1 hypothetical protein BU24DRAFT_488058 [Aaosphaeria arxii CBS 175.79]
MHSIPRKPISSPPPSTPDEPSNYKYPPFTDPANELRLLELQPSSDPSAPLVCKIEAYRLGAAPECILPEYLALSYVWGDASQREPILIDADDYYTNGEPGLRQLDISINLACALRRLRSLRSFDWESKGVMRLWADAICIDQTCIPERNSQVRIMHRIYASAQTVWIYPIDVSARSGTHGAARETRTMSRRHRTFFNEAYWGRAWCVQEIFFAKEVWILYGDQEAPLDFKSWKPGTPLVTGLGFFGQPPRHLQSEVYHLKRIKYTELVDASTGPHLLYNLLWQCRHRRAFLPQDKIYSLMNILPASTTLRQDYSKDSASVYGVFMKEVIKHGSSHLPCRPLDFLSPTHNISTPLSPGLPTWCPDFCEYADTVDILDNVPATHSMLTMFVRKIGRTQSKSEDYQPWFYLRQRCQADGQTTEGPVGTVIPSWDIPISPLSCLVAADVSDEEPDTELTIRGVRLGTLSQLGDVLDLHETKFTLAAPPEEAIRAWKPFGTGVYKPTLESASLALVKTLLINSRLSEWSQAAAAGVLKHVVFGADPDPGEAFSPSSFAADTPVAEYLAELKACLPGWRFAVTSAGHFAKVPNAAREDDVVCVPLGSSTPMVLRQKEGKRYELVGRCFVHGYMTGKAMFKLDIASQKVIGRRSKSELTEEDWNKLREIVRRELEPFILV